MGWRWGSLGKILDPWLASQADEAARSAVLRHMAQLAEEADWITGDEVAGRSPLIRSHYIEEAAVRLIWLRADQFHTLDLVKIETVQP